MWFLLGVKEEHKNTFQVVLKTLERIIKTIINIIRMLELMYKKL